MQNEFLNEFTPAESIKQVRQYFEIIDTSVSVGDTNRKYTPSKNTASPGGEQKENQFLTFNISPVGENICDLYNSVLCAEMIVKIKNKTGVSGLPKALATICNYIALWIGFKDSLDSVAAYQIYANGRQIYSQDSAHEESFITSCAATEAIKTVDVFSKARHKDIWERADTVKSGAIVSIDGGYVKSGDDEGKPIVVPPNTVFEVKIPIKIDLRRFLVLDSIRFLPAFAGNIQIKIKFSSEALQITPLSIEDLCAFNKFNITKLTNYPSITNKFVPFENEFTMITKVEHDASTNGITLTTGTQQFTKTYCTISNAYSYLNCFSLDANVYSELVEHYSQRALMFPIKRMDFLTMEGSLNCADDKKSVFTAAYTPIFVNTIYLLIKKEANYFCNYENPLFKGFQLNCGAYGNIPAEPESTSGPIFYETCANAMNTNNDLMGFNTDVMRSLTADKIENVGVRSNDTTNFFIGLPTETDFTFQQGMTSNSPISFKLTTTSSADTVGFNEKFIIGFLRHVCFSIQANPNGVPAVMIDEWDLSAPE